MTAERQRKPKPCICGSICSVLSQPSGRTNTRSDTGTSHGTISHTRPLWLVGPGISVVRT